MNSCEKIQEMISSMLDGELSAADEELVREHIALCEDCAAMYDDFSTLSNELNKELQEVPASLHSRIMKGVRTSQKPRKPLHILMRPYMGAAACLIIVGGIVLASQAGKLGMDFDVGSASRCNAEKAAVPAAPEMPAAPAAPEMPASPAEFDTFSYGELNEAEEAPAAPECPAEPMEMPANPEGFYIPDIIPGDEDSIKEHFQLTYDHRDTFGLLDFHFEPGLPLQNVYLAFFDENGKFISASIIEDTDALCTALVCEDRNWEAWDTIPVNRSAILEFECNGFPYSMELFFDGGIVVVESIDDYYRAVGSVEELLSIR